MEEDIISRFILLRKKFGPTQGKFGKLLGFKSDGNISGIESRSVKLTDRNIILICSTLGVNEIWLRTGKGPMFIEGKVPEEKSLLEIFRSLSPEGRKMVLEYAALILKNEKVMQGEGGEEQEIGPQERDGKAE